MNTQIRRIDAVIQRKLDRGIWRPSLDTGHIYSTEKHANLKEHTDHSGYCLVGSRKDIMVSRVIWIAAHGIPDAGMEVDHINGIKKDNRLENLQLVTPSENRMRSHAVLTFAEAESIREAHAAGASQKSLAKQYGVSPNTICCIIAGKTYKSQPPHELSRRRAEREIAALDSAAIADICAEYRLGASCTQLAARWHLTLTAVRTIVSRIGGRP